MALTTLPSVIKRSKTRLQLQKISLSDTWHYKVPRPASSPTQQTVILPSVILLSPRALPAMPTQPSVTKHLILIPLEAQTTRLATIHSSPMSAAVPTALLVSLLYTTTTVWLVAATPH